MNQQDLIELATMVVRVGVIEEHDMYVLDPYSPEHLTLGPRIRDLVEKLRSAT